MKAEDQEESRVSPPPTPHHWLIVPPTRWPKSRGLGSRDGKTDGF